MRTIRASTYASFSSSIALLFLLISPAGQAATILMNPDPVGDWICLPGHCSANTTTRTANVTLLAGDTGPAPTLEFRTSILGGGAFASSTVSFFFDLDVDITVATLTGSSGGITNGPVLLGLGNTTLEFVCGDNSPCTVDMEFELAGIPSSGTIRDSVNQFIDSPGAPSQTLPMTFSIVPIPAAAWLFGSALGLLAWIRRGR